MVMMSITSQWNQTWSLLVMKYNSPYFSKNLQSDWLDKIQFASLK